LDLGSHQQQRELNLPGAAPLCASGLSADGTCVVVGDTAGVVWLLDLRTGECRELARHDHRIDAVSFCATGRRVFSGSDGRMFAAWETRNGRLLKELRGMAQLPTVAFSPDGSKVIQGGQYACYAWDVETGKIAHEHSTNGTWTAAMGAHKYCAVASWTIELRRLDTGARVSGCSGHRAEVTALALTCADELLISGARDNKLVVWQTTPIEQLATFTLDSTPVAIAANNELALVLDADANLHLLQLPQLDRWADASASSAATTRA
jgi:WD40 repeat protein